MRQCIEDFMPDDRHYRVVDFGSFMKHDVKTHRDLLSGRDCSVLGVDIRSGRNVDVVMPRPYRIPLASNSVDVVFTGQVFEHIPFFFTSLLEIRRILKPGGRLFMTVPSRGHRHNVYDCWRFYPDSMRAMAAFAAFELERATTDLPPLIDGKLDYSQGNTYWGDTTGVFRKPQRSPRIRIAVVSRVMRWWSNSVGDLERHPIPE
jgi:SAM-dependent methyltransferase